MQNGRAGYPVAPVPWLVDDPDLNQVIRETCQKAGLFHNQTAGDFLLYHFCKEHYPHFLTAMSRAWIEAGMSLKKEPAERVRTKHVTPPEAWTVCTGTYRDNLRLCKLPASEEGRCYWYGFETESQQLRPVFAAVSQE